MYLSPSFSPVVISSVLVRSSILVSFLLFLLLPSSLPTLVAQPNPPFHYTALFDYFLEYQCSPPSSPPPSIPSNYLDVISFIPDLQIDITSPSHGQVFMSYTDLNVVVEVMLTPGVHVVDDGSTFERDNQVWWSLADSSGVKVCIALDGHEGFCKGYTSVGDRVGVPDDLEIGWHEVEVWVEHEGRRVGGCKGRVVNRFYVGGEEECQGGCFDYDGGGGLEWGMKNRTTLWREDGKDVEVEVGGCERGGGEEYAVEWELVGREGGVTRGLSGAVGGVVKIPVGKEGGTQEYCLKAKKIGGGGSSSVICFFVKDLASDASMRLPSPPPPHPKVIVTAANEDYLDRLANLIGSVNFWSPTYLIVVYDVGLLPSSRTLVSSWHNVHVKPLDVKGNGLPEHFEIPPLVAYKSWALEDAIRSFGVPGGSVVWLDANTEVRRPFWGVEDILIEEGYFFTLAGHPFPTHRNVRTETMGFLGDSEAHPLTQEVTSAIMGFRVGCDLGASVLSRMTSCAMDLKACHYPPGSTFYNQKRDQSGLNSILRTLPETPKVYEEEIYWAYATQKRLGVEEDETQFNDVVFYSRRGVGRMDYVSRIMPVPPEVRYTGEETNVHGALDEI